MSASLRTLYQVGIPYTKDDIASANADLKAQADPMADQAGFRKRYPKAQVRDFDGDPARLTEMDALIAYLQVLGTMVDVNAPAAQEDLAKEKGR
jgi:cytochrome c oxidase cbb3-type subunit 2